MIPAKSVILISNLLPLTILSSILIFCGLVLFSFFSIKNKVLALGSAMVLGPLGFIFILSIFSYLFKGTASIIVYFTLYFLLCIFLFFKNKKLSYLKNLFNFKFSSSNILTLIILIVYTGFIFLYTHRAFVGADANMYWAIATSFTKGNYPTVLPWQPQFLTVYHHGFFIFEGAINLLANSRINLTHYFFSAYSVLALFLIIAGFSREKHRSVLSLFPAILGTILIGGPILPLSFPNLFNGNNLVDFVNFQSSNGAGVVNLEGLIYENFYTFGLASFLFFVWVTQHLKKYSTFNLVILGILTGLITSIDETFFLICVPAILILFFWKIRRLVGLLIFLSTLLISLMVIQNPVRDSFLTPSLETPRFKILLENVPIFKNLFYQKGEIISWNGVNTNQTASNLLLGRINFASFRTLTEQSGSWMIADLRVILILLLALSILLRLRLVLYLTLASFFSLTLGILLINTFWPPNALRMINQAYQLTFIALGLISLYLLKLGKWQILGMVIIISLIPQLIVSHSKAVEKILSNREGVFTKPAKDQLLEEVSYFIPPNKVTIYLDRYPESAPHSYYNFTSLTFFGVFVPIAPPEIKILNPDPGIEWLDAVNLLSPFALKELGVEFVYIQDAALERLSEQRRAQLQNTHYFQKIHRFENDGTLYFIQPPFKNLADDGATLKKIVTIIGTDKKVYLDKLKLNEVRKALILALAKTNQLIGPPHAHGGDFYMYIETILPFEFSSSVNTLNPDFILLDPTADPNQFSGAKFTKVSTNPYVALWKNKYE